MKYEISFYDGRARVAHFRYKWFLQAIYYAWMNRKNSDISRLKLKIEKGK